jgi:hypothetical protein
MKALRTKSSEKINYSMYLNSLFLLNLRLLKELNNFIGYNFSTYKLKIIRLILIKMLFEVLPRIHIVGGGVQLGPLGTSATDWPIVLASGDYDDGEFGGTKIGKEN